MSALIKEFKISSVVRKVPRKFLSNLEPRRKKPERGDVMVCSVSKVGWHTELENRFGRYRRLFEGDKVAVAIGNRYATGEFEGKIPEKVRYGMDLLNAGGVCGKMVGKNLLISDPTRLTFIGYAIEGGEVVNLRNHAIPKKQVRRNVPIILVIGSGMDAGKTTTAATIIKSLVGKGHIVSAGKVTGTARSKDILFMRDAGAKTVLDHVDAGFPSTYKCRREQLLEIFEIIYSNLASDGPDYIILEVADGVFQRETRILLGHEDIMRRVAHTVFSASDSLSAYGGFQYLGEMGLRITAFAGPVANSKLTIREVFDRTGIKCISPAKKDTEEIYLRITGRP
jgi:molybdopterin-guanine dinucleotide biosynthesis protein